MKPVHIASSLGFHLHSTQTHCTRAITWRHKHAQVKPAPCILTFPFKYLENDICCVSCTATLLQAEKLSITEKKSQLGACCKSRLRRGRRETCFYMGLTVATLQGRRQAAMPASLQLRETIYLWNSSEQQHGLYKCCLRLRKCHSRNLCTRRKLLL